MLLVLASLLAVWAWLPRVPPRPPPDPFFGPDRRDLRPTALVVHHTAVAAHAKLTRADDPVARIHRYHTEVRGWAAVGYHFLVGADGDLHVGRRLTTSGAHAGQNGFNRVSAGVALLGDCEKTPPTQEQYASLVFTLATLQAYLDIPAERVVGHAETDLLVPGALTPGAAPEALAKEEAYRRACPGKTVDLRILRQLLATLRHRPPPPGALAPHLAPRGELVVQAL